MMTLSNRLSFCASLVAFTASVVFGQETPAAEKLPDPVSAVKAEIWPYEIPKNVHSRTAFEQMRAEPPAGEPQTLAINGLAIPARERDSMVRVSGLLNVPVTGHYVFFPHSPGTPANAQPDETELWIFDHKTSEWKLAQAAGKSVDRVGHTRLEKNVPYRFELWTMGKSAVSVDWESRDWDPKTKNPIVALTRQIIPSTALQELSSAIPETNQNTGPNPWNQRHGLSLEKPIGPESPWGDPDGDGLLNWQERRSNLNPRSQDCKGSSGIVLWEVWRDIPGQYVFDLRRAPHFPMGNREIRFLEKLSIPSGYGNQHGARVRGFLTAPTDGEYTFKIAASGSAEFWLGTNDSWQTKRLIAQTDQRNAGSSGWTITNAKGEKIPVHPEQTATITLKAGQKYYLELLYKHDGGSASCRVVWIMPGSKNSQLITSQHLSSFQPCPTDSDDDGLPDEWQRGNGLLGSEVAEHLRHAEADPDFDGATNRDEWLAQTNPLNAADFPAGGGFLTCETWTAIPGHHLNSLVKHPNFPARPSATTRIDNIDFRQEGENYGVRLRGYLTAPEDGNYSFSISGNNAASLYLGKSEDKFTKQLAASVEVGTQWRSFTGGGHLRSGAIPLKRGEKYYIEVLYKRGINGKSEENRIDHTSVAWTRPNRNTAVIASEFFSSYHQDPRDRDDDDLPDEWETLHGLDTSDPSAQHGAWGDPDGDGLENLREFQLGLNPTQVDVRGQPGLALWEGWYDSHDLISAHKERDGLAPALLADPRFPLQPSSLEWRHALEAPRRQGTNFAARLRAHIVAPTTGEYVFSIAGRDVGELFLSPDASKFKRSSIATLMFGTSFHSWDKREGQMSQPIRLEAGKTYYIEALYARGPFEHTDDFFSIGWKIPGDKEFKLIEANHLIAFHRDPNDQDDDDLPDDWEGRYGLDATDPRGNNGPLGDPDRDGFTNAEELRRNTNPTNKDTDGDGISDYDEVHTYRTNPLVKDTIPPVELIRFPLASANYATSSPWIYGKDGSITSVNRRGSLSYEFNLEKPGIYAITLVANAAGSGSYVPSVPVSVSVSGIRIGHTDFPAQSTTRTWLTPWLPAGRHQVIVENHNVRANVAFTVRSLALSHFDGKDVNQHGVPSWLANTLVQQNSASTRPLQSAVSPCFIEGICRFPQSVSATAADRKLAVVDHFIGHWHANVPLNPDASPTQLQLNFENGTQSESHEILWVPTNLAQAPAINHLRLGDSIRVVAQSDDSDTFTLRYGNQIWENHSATQPVTIVFDQPGTFTLSATWARGGSASVTYQIHQADFGASVAVPAGGSRVWTPKNVLPPLEIEADQGISLTPKAAPASAASGTPQAYLIANATTTSGPRGLVARLPGQGSILATGTIDSFVLSSGSKTADAHLVGTLPDGTRVIEVSYIIDGPVPADLSLWIRLYVTDAVFSNGLTWLHLTAADFDENGVAKFRVLKAPGTGTPYVCHWILPYADFEDVLNLRQPR